MISHNTYTNKPDLDKSQDMQRIKSHPNLRNKIKQNMQKSKLRDGSMSQKKIQLDETMKFTQTKRLFAQSRERSYHRS